MSLRKIFCPNCGQETKVDDSRVFCFCLQCGSKIALQAEESIIGKKRTAIPDISSQRNHTQEKDELTKKLEEVAFYYKLSSDKGEYKNYEEEPLYYLKAQDLLIELSEQYAEDYRVWWELCKPVDYEHPLEGTDIYEQYHINEDCFDKALARAELSIKRKLIEEHDAYIDNKKLLMSEREKKRLELDARQKEAAEAAKQKAALLEKEQRQKEEEERQKEEMRLAELHKAAIEKRQALWSALNKKDYSQIDNSFFTFSTPDNQTCIGIFKAVSNMMYLMAFRIDKNRSNIVYQEQSLGIKFDERGYGIKFDNRPVIIRGLLPPNNILLIECNGSGELSVNGMDLTVDTEYVMGIITNAKKSMLSFTKIFN